MLPLDLQSPFITKVAQVNTFPPNSLQWVFSYICTLPVAFPFFTQIQVFLAYYFSAWRTCYIIFLWQACWQWILSVSFLIKYLFFLYTEKIILPNLKFFIGVSILPTSTVYSVLFLLICSSSYFSVQFSSVAQSCTTLWDLMDCNTAGLPVYHQLPELTQTHVHWVSDAIQPTHPLSSPFPPAFNLSQHPVFSNQSILRIRWPKYWSFSFSISPSNEYSDWFLLG